MWYDGVCWRWCEVDSDLFLEDRYTGLEQIEKEQISNQLQNKVNLMVWSLWLDIRPHRRRSRIIPSYSPDGANVYRGIMARYRIAYMVPWTDVDACVYLCCADVTLSGTVERRSFAAVAGDPGRRFQLQEGWGRPDTETPWGTQVSSCSYKKTVYWILAALKGWIKQAHLQENHACTKYTKSHHWKWFSPNRMKEFL